MFWRQNSNPARICPPNPMTFCLGWEGTLGWYQPQGDQVSGILNSSGWERTNWGGGVCVWIGGPTTIATGWPLRRDVDRTTAVALVPHPVPRVQAQASCFAFKSRVSSGVICIGQIVISSLIYLCPCKHGLEPLQSPESSCVFLPAAGTKTRVHLLCSPSTSGPIYTGPGFSCSQLFLNEPYK